MDCSCCCCLSRLLLWVGGEQRETNNLLASVSDTNSVCDHQQRPVRRYDSMAHAANCSPRRTKIGHKVLSSRKSEPAIQMQKQRQSVSGTSQASKSSTATIGEDIKLAVIGAQRVGKTALVNQFLWRVFISEYKPTVEDFNWIEYELADTIFKLQIIDTSGSNEFLAMRQLYTKTADAFLLVFAVDDVHSFEEIKKMYADIKAENVKNAPVLLLANKIDLCDDESQWAVGEDAVVRFVTDAKLPYTALSASNSDTVEQVFRQVLLKTRSVEPSEPLRKRRQSMPAVQGRSSANLDPKDFAKIRAAAEASERREKNDKNCVIS